jgi:uncharacterized membrane protein
MALGLILFVALLIWKLMDDLYHNTMDFKTERQNAVRRAIVGVAAMSVFVIGIVIFIRKSMQRFTRPFIGPNNFFLYGHAFFGSGALCYLLLQTSRLQGNNVSYPWPLFMALAHLQFIGSRRVIIKALRRNSGITYSSWAHTYCS